MLLDLHCSKLHVVNQATITAGHLIAVRYRSDLVTPSVFALNHNFQLGHARTPIGNRAGALSPA